MANIRGFRNINQNGNQGRDQQQGNMLNGIDLPFLSTVSPNNPREENFCSMLILTLCPKVRLFSVSVFLVSVITILYITMLSIGGTTTDGTLSFLQIKRSTLEQFGANIPSEVVQGQVYRWFSSIFLAYDFLNWIGSCVFLAIICSSIESFIGMRDTIVIYVFGGVVGAIFGDVTQCCDDGYQYYSEINSAIYALVGGFVATLILLWNKLEQYGPMRTLLGCMIFMMVLFMLLFAFSGSTMFSDNLGGLGGFLGGLFIGMSVLQIGDQGSYEKNVRYFGMGSLAILVGLSVILLFSLNS